MPDDEKRAAHRALEERIVRGDGRSSVEDRERAFANAGLPLPLSMLIEKVVEHPTQISAADLQVPGLSEDEVFELVVCAAVGTSARMYDAALAALVEATSEGRPVDAS
jgi:hypothetical protein